MTTIRLVEYGSITHQEIVLFDGSITPTANRLFDELAITDLLSSSNGITADVLIFHLEDAVCQMATHELKFWAMTSDLQIYGGKLYQVAFDFLRGLLNACRKYPGALVISQN